MGKYDVIHKTGCTQHIAIRNDRATATGNTHRKFGEVRTCGSRDMHRGQTDKPVHRNTPLAYTGNEIAARTYRERAEDARVDGGGTDGVVGTAAGRRRRRTSEDECVLGRVDDGRRQRQLVLQSCNLHLRSTAVVTTDRLHVRQPFRDCLLYTSPSPRDRQKSRMPSSA